MADRTDVEASIDSLADQADFRQGGIVEAVVVVRDLDVGDVIMIHLTDFREWWTATIVGAGTSPLRPRVRKLAKRGRG
jgi:hypothetical protein